MCDLINEAIETFNITHTQVLSTSTFRLVKRPPRSLREHLSNEVKDRITTFINSGDVLTEDPNDHDFLAFCTTIDDVDAGEAILISHARQHGSSVLFTADKKFFRAIQRSPELLNTLKGMERRFICIEQVFLLLIDRYGYDYVCTKTSSLCEYDTGLRLVFRSSATDYNQHVYDGLTSAVQDAHAVMGSLLANYTLERSVVTC